MAEHPSHSTPQEGDGFTYEHFADRQVRRGVGGGRVMQGVVVGMIGGSMHSCVQVEKDNMFLNASGFMGPLVGLLQHQTH